MNDVGNESILPQDKSGLQGSQRLTANSEEYSRDFQHIETLLKEQDGRRRNASKTIRETDKYIQFGGTQDTKSELIETISLSSPKLSADRIQSTAEPDTKTINLVDGLDDHLMYFNDSIRRRRESAIRTIKELDELIECVEQLPEKFQTIIQNLYYSYEIEIVNGYELRKKPAYTTAMIASGYKSDKQFETYRKQAIAMLVKAMRQKRKER